MIGYIFLGLLILWVLFTLFCMAYTVYKRQQRGEYLLTGKKRNQAKCKKPQNMKIGYYHGRTH